MGVQLENQQAGAGAGAGAGEEAQVPVALTAEEAAQAAYYSMFLGADQGGPAEAPAPVNNVEALNGADRSIFDRPDDDDVTGNIERAAEAIRKENPAEEEKLPTAAYGPGRDWVEAAWCWDPKVHGQISPGEQAEIIQHAEAGTGKRVEDIEPRAPYAPDTKQQEEDEMARIRHEVDKYRLKKQTEGKDMHEYGPHVTVDDADVERIKGIAAAKKAKEAEENGETTVSRLMMPPGTPEEQAERKRRQAQAKAEQYAAMVDAVGQWGTSNPVARALNTFCTWTVGSMFDIPSEIGDMRPFLRYADRVRDGEITAEQAAGALLAPPKKQTGTVVATDFTAIT